MTLMDNIKLENSYDEILQIITSGRDDTNSDEYFYPYEPTPYSVLERLADSGYIGCDDVLIDYGSGKGRVDFFISNRTGAKTIGVEYDERIYLCATENMKTCVPVNCEFVHAKAEEYKLPKDVNRCYFFNPFSRQILEKVFARILESYYESPREILMFFYFPSDEYISHLMCVNELEFYDEIPCDDLFSENAERERILIFGLPHYE